MTTKYLDTIESVEGAPAVNHIILKSQNSETEYRVACSANSDSYALSTSFNAMNLQRDKRLLSSTSARG